MSTLAEQYVKGFEEGEIKGVIKGRVATITKILSSRFKKVPDSISRSLSLYTDSIALDSLAILAADCGTLEEFGRGLCISGD
jgi:hypothetical protein